MVRSASGAVATGDVPITAKNLPDYAPAPSDVDAAVRAFEEAGFETGPPLGIAFSIAGPVALFAEVFLTGVRQADDGGFVCGREGEEPVRELPLAALPEDVAALLVAVTFEPPAEVFGAGDAWE